jgi:hypothetical protein
MPSPEGAFRTLAGGVNVRRSLAESSIQLGKGEEEFEVKDAEPRRGVQNISRGRKPPVMIQKKASPGGATDCN